MERKEMRSILFVDDEVNVLQGLRRMLRSMRREWDISFAPGGGDALDMMFDKTFDAVVSDIRMPGMSGFEFLTEVKKRYPMTARLVLSGTADKKDMLEAVGLIHQYLPKPCDAEILKTTLSRLFSHFELISSEKLKRLISQLGAIPSLPTIYGEVMELIVTPDVTTKKLGEIINKDIGMSSKLLQLVNSPFLGRRHHVSSPAEAAEFAGIEIIHDLAMKIEVFFPMAGEEIERFQLEPLWEHSILVGDTSRKIALAEQADTETVDFCYIAGLLHDVGKLVFSQILPDEYDSLKKLARDDPSSMPKQEKRSFEASHAEAGAFLLGLWGLPEPIVKAVADHHHPPGKGEVFSPRIAVFASNIMGHGGNLEQALGTEWGDKIGKWTNV